MEKKNVTLKMLGLIIFSVIVITLTRTFAFHEITPDNSNKSNVIVNTANNLKLIYTDCSNEQDCANISQNLKIGESVTKTFQIKNEATIELEYNLYFKELQNSFKNDELVYKIENTDTNEILIDTTPVPYHKFPVTNVTIKENIPIKRETTHNYKLTITFLNKDYMQDENLNAVYSIKLSFVKKEKPDFSKVALTNEGIYALEDDYGMSYYYRGDIKNNYVKFGKNANGQDMWWRIIRINGDGSLRILYDGTQGWENGVADNNRIAVLNVRWNSKYNNDAKYVGWMFGGAQGVASTSYEEAVKNETESAIKTAVDNWYVANIKNTGYEKYLSDELFCNDRTPYTDESGTTIGGGYGSVKSFYGVYLRLRYAASPDFKCRNINDRFTVKEGAELEIEEFGTVEGNKALNYPVGLMTADEVISAGGGWATNNENYYVFKSRNIFNWVFSPTYVPFARIYSFRDTGALNTRATTDLQGGASPVINIASKYADKMIGTGTINDPYRL